MVTTNFDNLLESALKHIKKVAFSISNHHDVAKMPLGEQVNVLKLHGDINAPHEVVLSRSDYDQYFTMRPAVSAMLKGLLLNRTFLFVGYSLRDPNLITIFNEVSGLLSDAKRPAYAVVFEATDADVKTWREKGVYILRVLGEDTLQKTFSLWLFLDLLQQKHFAPTGAWLAEDAAELLPETDSENLTKQLGSLKSVLTKFSYAIQENVNPEVVDFLLPWLLLGAKNGLYTPSTTWQSVALHYRNRKPVMESNQLAALSAMVNALRASQGKWEKGALAELNAIEDILLGKSKQ